MRICLFDGPDRSDLLPLVYTRPIADLLIGGMSLAKRWSQAVEAEVVVETCVAWSCDSFFDTLYSYCKSLSRCFSKPRRYVDEPCGEFYGSRG